MYKPIPTYPTNQLSYGTFWFCVRDFLAAGFFWAKAQKLNKASGFAGRDLWLGRQAGGVIRYACLWAGVGWRGSGEVCVSRLRSIVHLGDRCGGGVFFVSVRHATGETARACQFWVGRTCVAALVSRLLKEHVVVMSSQALVSHAACVVLQGSSLCGLCCVEDMRLYVVSCTLAWVDRHICSFFVVCWVCGGVVGLAGLDTPASQTVCSYAHATHFFLAQTLDRTHPQECDRYLQLDVVW